MRHSLRHSLRPRTTRPLPGHLDNWSTRSLLGGIWKIENETWHMGNNNHMLLQRATGAPVAARDANLGVSLLGSGEPNLQRRLRVADTGKVWHQRHMRISPRPWRLPIVKMDMPICCCSTCSTCKTPDDFDNRPLSNRQHHGLHLRLFPRPLPRDPRRARQGRRQVSRLCQWPAQVEPGVRLVRQPRSPSRCPRGRHEQQREARESDQVRMSCLPRSIDSSWRDS